VIDIPLVEMCIFFYENLNDESKFVIEDRFLRQIIFLQSMKRYGASSIHFVAWREGQVSGREVSMVAINYSCLRRAFASLLWIAVLKSKNLGGTREGTRELVHLSSFRTGPEVLFAFG
jgi:hypothetical protein